VFWSDVQDASSYCLVGAATEAPRLDVPSPEKLEQIVATLESHRPEVKRLLKPYG